MMRKVSTAMFVVLIDAVKWECDFERKNLFSLWFQRMLIVVGLLWGKSVMEKRNKNSTPAPAPFPSSNFKGIRSPDRSTETKTIQVYYWSKMKEGKSKITIVGRYI